jgi:hypothetical protein
MAEQKYATPAAVLLGAALIASGLYFGLRARPVVIATQPEVTAAAVKARAGPAERPAATPLVAPYREAEVDEDVKRALEKLRPTLISACWTPAISRNPNPSRSTYEYDLAFDEAGSAIGVGVSEVDANSRGDVAQCLRRQTLPIEIAGRGVRSHARATITLP